MMWTWKSYIAARDARRAREAQEILANAGMIKLKPEKADSTQCAECGWRFFHTGPEGGGSMNIRCANKVCGAEWTFHGFGSMDRIDRNKPEYYSTGFTHIGNPEDKPKHPRTG
jgi:hypothetical protein